MNNISRTSFAECYFERIAKTFDRRILANKPYNDKVVCLPYTYKINFV